MNAIIVHYTIKTKNSLQYYSGFSVEYDDSRQAFDFQCGESEHEFSKLRPFAEFILQPYLW